LHEVLQRDAILELQHNQDEINKLALSACGQLVAAVDDSGDAKVVELQTGKLLKSLSRQHSNVCTAVAFRRGKRSELVTGGLDQLVLIWDYRVGRVLRRFDLADQASHSSAEPNKMLNPPMVNDIAVSKSDQHLAVARGDGVASIIHLRSGNEEIRCELHSAAVTQVQLSSWSEDTLLTGSNDATIAITNLHSTATRSDSLDAKMADCSVSTPSEHQYQVLHRIDNHGAKVNALLSTAEGLIYVADTTNTIRAHTLS